MTQLEAVLRGMQASERGWIILVLADLVPGAADATMVRHALSQLHVPIDQQHYRNHLAYLEERGYLRLERVALGSLTNTVLQITATGRDLRSGVIQDAGIDMTVGQV